MAAAFNAGRDATMTFDDSTEVYIVKPAIWKRTGLEDFGGCLCIGCLEGRIGRRLTPKDFPRSASLNKVPGTTRLTSRRDHNAR
jgi:hypothetical protein